MINVSDQPAPRSLIVTLYGAYGRFAPGPVPVAELIRLLAAVGVDAPSVRSSVSRLKRRGLLLPARTAQGAAGYELSAEARQLLDGRRPAHLRHRASRGRGLGAGGVLGAGVGAAEAACAAVAAGGAGLRHGGARGVDRPGAAARGDPAHAASGCDLDAYVDLFRGEHSASRRPRRRSARWWDLAAIAKQHEAFLDRHARGAARLASSGRTPRREEAYRDYLLALDSWRHLPYADPGLPARLLPRGLAGRRVRRPSSRGCTSGCGTRGRSSPGCEPEPPGGRWRSPARAVGSVDPCPVARRRPAPQPTSSVFGSGGVWGRPCGRCAGGGCPPGTGAGQGAPGPA